MFFYMFSINRRNQGSQEAQEALSTFKAMSPEELAQQAVHYKELGDKDALDLIALAATHLQIGFRADGFAEVSKLSGVARKQALEQKLGSFELAHQARQISQFATGEIVELPFLDMARQQG